ncbi:Alcohol oxidase [Lachnellula suecica]|uniref:Alcohol oxidase n=1 Tax=Lachnellula suecica TaxID=602035 RepID=A0A8T9C9N7_9HELO|nr:Alcohol oxidase [Lachnellula suecica]
MAIYTELPSNLQESDVVIVGALVGGSAGCIIAARLADADPNLSVLVIEGGTNNFGEPLITNPGFLFVHTQPGNKFMRYLKGSKSRYLGGRETVVPCGGVLGGGSSVNLMLYSRAQRSDFDAWKTPGWSADELLPYLKRIETYHGEDEYGCHGHNGPIHVSGSRFRAPRLENDFINAVKKLDYPEVNDINDLETGNGVMRALRYVSPEGKRQDTAHTYIHPRLADGKHPNLHVLVESRVERVLFEGNRAVGVIYSPNPAFQPGTGSASRMVRARKLVVLSCGALGTPLLLERSGVGSPEIVRRAAVDLVADLPGVGRHYEDHHMMLYPYASSLGPDETLDALNAGRLDPGALIKENHKILGWNSVDAQCKLRPTKDDLATLGPAFQEAWNKEFRDLPDKPMMIMSLIACFPGDPSLVPAGQYFGIATFSLYPYSRGHLHITGPGLDDIPDFDLGFMSDPDDIDLKKHVWIYKKHREIIRRMSVYRGEVASGHPPFPAHSQAATIATDGPVENVKDIEYTAEDDAIIEEWIRGHVDTTWHSLGTCKMAPREDFGVVDSSLSVYDVENLKIADLSIPPSNVGANTNHTAMTIGEKAAGIFIKELALDKY